MKRIILAKGKHWFYRQEALLGSNQSGRTNLVGMLDEHNRLIPFEKLPQSGKSRLVLEIYEDDTKI
jgi:hypothetical protein